MSKGKNGGISLLPNFVLNKTVLSDEEKGNILSALYSLNTLDDTSVERTLSKLGLFFGKDNSSIFEIDYNDWGSLIKEQFEKSRTAILSHKLLSFDYISSQNNMGRRIVEPYILWFKDKTWYLKAFCRDKGDVRVFRFSRMRNIVIEDELFVPRKIDWQTGDDNSTDVYPTTKIVMRVESDVRYRVLDEFPDSDVTINSDGSFIVTMNFIETDWVYGYILSFGASATVLEPERIKKVIQARLEDSLKNYL